MNNLDTMLTSVLCRIMKQFARGSAVVVVSVVEVVLVVVGVVLVAV